MLFPLPFEVDGSGPEEEGSTLSMESSNFSASGVEKRVIDFWQNLRADGLVHYLVRPLNASCKIHF